MKLKFIVLLAFVLFLPSLFNYFSHDDFFNLQLAKAGNVADFLRFFDLFHHPDRVGSFRPLTTQVYFLISRFFNFSPLPLHIIAFGVFFADIFLVYKLAKELAIKEKGALAAAFLYAVSATHFAHLYWPSLFQETGLVFFFLSTVLLFMKKRHFLSFIMMLGALASKETAITIPPVLTLLFFKDRLWKNWRILLPFWTTMLAFLFVHLKFFGLPPGEVYKMDFSAKVANTLMWYVLWAFNLPELFVDYIGPGLTINTNLIRFYGVEVITILFFFAITLVCLVLILKKRNLPMILFGLAWFLGTLVPVIFLPWHKFTYELGVPLIGLVLIIAWPLERVGKRLTFLFCLAWLLTSFFTLNLTVKTHWITIGPQISMRVKNYFNSQLPATSLVVFYDTTDDKKLPWSPAGEVKINLSNQDFFEVYYPGKFMVSYQTEKPEKFTNDTTYIPARQFLGY